MRTDLKELIEKKNGGGKPRRASAFKHVVRIGRATVKMTDEGIEQYVLAEWLKLHKIFALHIPNEGKRSFQEGLMLKALGLEPGAADYLILQSPPDLPGCKGVCIEMKSKTGKATDAQSAWLIRAREHGFLAQVCNSGEEAIRVLQGLGYGRRPSNRKREV
jgi:hypothetical protein